MEVRAYARAGSQQPFSVYTDWRLSAMGAVRPLMVVEGHPFSDPLAVGLEREKRELTLSLPPTLPAPIPDKNLMGLYRPKVRELASTI